MLLPLLLVTLGLGVLAFGLAQQRMSVTAMPDDVDIALGNAALPDPDSTPRPGVVYRALEPLLASGGSLVRRVSPVRRIQLSRDRIVWAGLEGSFTLEKLLGYKAAGFVAGGLFGLLGAPGSVPLAVWAGGLAGAASFVPDAVLSSRATERQNQIARALPEALDLLALTVEAGLGFEQAIEVVVDNTTGPLSGELTRLLREIELGVPRRDALAALRERTDVPELSSFVVALVQSDQMGIALADVLKTQAAQVRLKRRQRAREQAAKTPVKILFPVVLGIFPALFVVTIGPGAINIARSIL
ncbi:MAG: type II secretion system F family protein [Mycobacteriales bacterium]|nr:type II secretion system F family protein [Mycobacteriales bacterium]